MATYLIITSLILGLIAYVHVCIFPVNPDPEKLEPHRSCISPFPDDSKLPELAPSPKITSSSRASLPTELRLQIWQYHLAARPPRTIRIKESGHPTEETFTRSAAGAAPTLLHVCSDSRQEALKFYSVLLPHHLPYPIYIDYSRDHLVIGCHEFEEKAVNGAFTLMRIMGWMFDSERKNLGSNLRRLELRGDLDSDFVFHDLAKLHCLERLLLPCFRDRVVYDYYLKEQSGHRPTVPLERFYTRLKHDREEWLRLKWKSEKKKANEGEPALGENTNSGVVEEIETFVSFGDED